MGWNSLRRLLRNKSDLFWIFLFVIYILMSFQLGRTYNAVIRFLLIVLFYLPVLFSFLATILANNSFRMLQVELRNEI